jgi:tetratricopeptide (TPR) repeat protein
MKILVRLYCLFITPLIGWSQTAQYVSTNHSLDSNIAQPRILALSERKVLPLFGEQRKTSDQIEEEIKFLSGCDKMFSSREEASAFFTARAWEYVQEGQLDTATYRFNLSYLLNEKNVDNFWGLGVVCYQKNLLEAAERMMQQGVSLAPDNVPLLVDLSTIELRHFGETQDQDDLNESYQLLKRAESLDTTYAQTFFNLAIAEFHRTNYPKAWEALHSGRKLNFALVDFQFVDLLREKLVDPEGFFK